MTRVLRLITILLSLVGVLGLRSSQAQQTTKLHRIGYLDASSYAGTAPLLQAFQWKMRELSWVEEKNIFYDYRFAEHKGNWRLQELAHELVSRRVDIIVARATNGSMAARQATSTIPIVMTSGGDPVGTGLIESLAMPGGNITGVNSLAPELSAKRLEILREVMRKIVRIGVLTTERGAFGTERQIKEIERMARLLEVTPHYLETGREPFGLERAVHAAMRQKVEAIIPLSGPGLFAKRRDVVSALMKYRLPAIYPTKEFVEAGGLMSYGVDNPDQFRRAAVFVDKILRGANPADLPVEQPTKFEFVINLKAAKQIGVTIPPQVLMDADRVIR